MGVPLLVTDMSMSVGRVLPRTVSMTFGTPELVARARAGGRRHVDLLMPPVDVSSNAPGAVEGAAFRDEHGIASAETLVVTVSRLAPSLKADSLRRTIAAVRSLGPDVPMRFALVGDGALREELQRLADDANSALRRQAIVLVGPMHDPRPAYAAADVVVGMGGSALRAMAFAKPTIVVGERGFSELFTPTSSSQFYYEGMFGVGGGEGADRLAKNLRAVLADRASTALGAFGRDFVVSHYSIEVVGQQLASAYRAARERRIGRTSAVADAIRTGGVFVGGVLRHVISWPPRLPPARSPLLQPLQSVQPVTGLARAAADERDLGGQATP
jgi:glycosyltransferase involved in cell wall biosynthesis